MKRNVLLIVVLGLSLYGVVAGLGHWASSENEALGYSTERMVEAAYRVPARTAYTPPAAGNSAVAVPMSAPQGSPFRHTYVPAANYTVSTPMLRGGSYAAQGLTLTSQSRQQSYGGSGSVMGAFSSTRMGNTGSNFGGSSYAMGGSVSSGYVSSSTYTYSINAGGGISVNGNMTSTFSPSAVYASAPAPYASFNNDFGAIAGSYSVLDGAVMPLDEASSLGHGILRRLNNNSAYNSWIEWLNQTGYQYGTDNGDGTYSYNYQQAYAAYEAWCASLSPSMPRPSFDEWLSWFQSENNISGHHYLPVGTITPLLLMALLYIVLLAMKRRKCSLNTRHAMR